jgi:hypothetical protein
MGRSRLRRYEGGLDLDAPEGGVGFSQGYADVPSFVTTPYDFALGAAAFVGKDQANFAPQGQIGSYDGHTTRMADVYGHAISTTPVSAIFPFDKKTKAGDCAFVRTHSCPPFFELMGQRR